MTAWIDPSLLQIVGTGTKGDSYLQNGRHLRWFFGRLLGFPRTGFRLRRGASPSTPTQWKNVEAAGVLRSQLLSEAEVGPFTHRFANGLTVSKQGGLAFQTIEPSAGSFVRVDANAVYLDFGHEGPSATPPIGPAATNPAAWVRLTVLRRQRTGNVAATAYANGHGTWHFEDRAAVGFGLGPIFDDLDTAERLLVEGTPFVSRIASHLGAHGVRAWRTAADAEWRLLAPRRPPGIRRARPVRPPIRNPWVAETLLLHGGLIERIAIVGRDAAVVRADWFPTRAYAEAPLWSDIDLLFLPLTDAPEIYPAWTTTPGEEVAKNRVMSTPPRALPPWDEPIYPPPPAPPGAVEDDLGRRYLGPGYERMRDAMKTFLAGELGELKPQALVTVTETLEAEPPDESFDGGALTVSPFDLLVGASVDPNVARLLGLMATDATPIDGTWDYVVDAGFPSRWLLWALLEGASAAPIDDVDDVSLPGIGDEMLRAAEMRNQTCLSMATGIVVAALAPPEAPADLQADVVPAPSARPIEAEVHLGWQANVENLFEAHRRVRVFYAVRRKSDDGDVPVHAKDDETSVLLPHVPTRSVTTNGRVRIRDTGVPAYGAYTWRVSGMDLWGRFSPFADVPLDVTDIVPPPAPPSLRATLLGAASAAPAWIGLRLTFDWSDGAASAAPDVERFEVHVRQGPTSPSDADSPASWGRLEHTPGATSPPLRIEWPAGTVVAPPGVSATLGLSAIAAADGGGTRIAVDIAPMVVPFGAAGEATVAATVRAVDRSGNASHFARPAVATRADATPPPPPPPSGVLRYATRPDAIGRATYRLALAPPAAGTLQVMRCSAAALLGAASVDEPTFRALDETARVNLLQALATQHRGIFAADHEVPYPESATAHVVELNGNDRGWTLATTIGTSRTGVREPWPTDPLRFDVIAVPRLRVPPMPVVIEARGTDRGATIAIAPDPTGTTDRVRIYRTRERAATADVRTMRPVATIAASGAPQSFADTDLFADITYFYRVEALGEDGVRSPATSPVVVAPFTTEPPLPPEVTKVVRLTNPARRRVQWSLARRDYAVSLLRRAAGTPWWAVADTAASRPDGTLDLATLTPAIDDGRYAYSIVDTVPDPAARWSYRVRVADPHGRIVHSAAVEEQP